MAASNRYRNVSVAWTPSGGTMSPLTGIKNATYDEGIETLLEGADYDAFNTVGGAIFAAPKISLETLDAWALYATVAGQKGTLAVTFRDTLNGAAAAGGAKLVTMSNAFLSDRKVQAPYNKFQTQSIMFECTSTDGSTHPVAVSTI
jgi:hypothetical protein